MDAVTYPDEKVADAMSENMIPVRVPFDAQPLSTDYNIQWTPTLIVLDDAKRVHHRSTGFLPPEEMIPALLLSRGKTHFGQKELEDAVRIFSSLVKEHPRSHAAPEAAYYEGVSKYKQEDRPGALKEAYERLQKEWPDSEWAVKSMPYRLL